MVVTAAGIRLGHFGRSITGINMKNKKELGQHWLNDRIILDEIADEAVCDAKLCVEIGPGLGTLTSSLLKRFEKVLAVEFDEKLAKNLPGSFPGTNLEVINEDILKFDFSKITEPFAVAGNIPYYITSPIILKLLYLGDENLAESDSKSGPVRQNAASQSVVCRPQKIALLIQKEVAERITAGPGKHSVLSLTVQNRADVEYGVDVPKNYFTPPPKVDSASIILTPHAPLVSEKVINFIKLGFSQPRKKLTHNLPYEKTKLLEIFKELGISENARPADLSLEQWKSLFEKF